VPSRRAEIELSEAERRELIDSERIVAVASFGPRGWPHVMPLWYVPRDGEIWIYTYAKSQKVRNLERDPRCTLQVETGEAYNELRGVMIKAECELVRDLDAIAALGAELAVRYGGGSLDDALSEAMRKQAAKRIGMRFVATSMATWDHRKLGGGY
jgi:nitroimidazol reductase NimA-like FMN-containing flavoprotein (pyridoxamine 5'-phosphate oxidase superfamily)